MPSIGFEDNGWFDAYCPRQRGQRDHRPGLRNPCGLGPSLKRAQVQLYRAWFYDHSTRLPSSEELCDGARSGDLRSPPLEIAFTFWSL
jgi:hypothetical protein